MNGELKLRDMETKTVEWINESNEINPDSFKSINKRTKPTLKWHHAVMMVCYLALIIVFVWAFLFNHKKHNEPTPQRSHTNEQKQQDIEDSVSIR